MGEDVQKLYSYGKQNYFYCDFAFEESRLPRIPLLGGAATKTGFAVSESPGREEGFFIFMVIEAQAAAWRSTI
ncbi:MAG: hypothetical protein ACLUD2_06580 [Clostridium sp.]